MPLRSDQVSVNVHEPVHGDSVCADAEMKGIKSNNVRDLKIFMGQSYRNRIESAKKMKKKSVRKSSIFYRS